MQTMSLVIAVVGWMIWLAGWSRFDRPQEVIFSGEAEFEHSSREVLTMLKCDSNFPLGWIKCPSFCLSLYILLLLDWTSWCLVTLQLQRSVLTLPPQSRRFPCVLNSDSITWLTGTWRPNQWRMNRKFVCWMSMTCGRRAAVDPWISLESACGCLATTSRDEENSYSYWSDGHTSCIDLLWLVKRANNLLRAGFITISLIISSEISLPGNRPRPLFFFLSFYAHGVNS